MPTRFQRRASALACATALAVACAVPGSAFAAGAPRQQAPAPIERRPPSPRPENQQNAAARHGTRGEHLAEWMNQHSNLTPQQQQQALEREPGFRELPQQTQQRMRDRLAQLDAMTPVQRQRLLARTEAMERLTPDQRSEVRGAMAQLGNLPQDQRRMVAHTFRELRELPPEQRISAYASGRYGQLNDNQRAVLFNLLRVEPMLPPPDTAPPQQAR